MEDDLAVASPAPSGDDAKKSSQSVRLIGQRKKDKKSKPRDGAAVVVIGAGRAGKV